ncbi:phenylacetate--CoA ligase family protein [bacterium]|nr:MAG: phenylacetate--CoA ligase family protein [bacterium]
MIEATTWPPRYDLSYRPAIDEPHWDRRLETMDPAERSVLILAKLKAQIAWCWERSPFYREKWQAAGFEPGDLRALDDFSRMPVLRKGELREEQAAHPPFGRYTCDEPSTWARIHGTSGTTGKPTGFIVSRDDMARISEAQARVMWGMGFRPSDTLFVASLFSLYMGSWGALLGGERLGMMCFPFGAGIPGMTKQALTWLREVKPSGFYGTPSYALRLAEVAVQEGLDPRALGLRKMFFSGEPGAGIPSVKARLEETFGAKVFDSGSTAEMTPWITDGECSERRGMHLWQDIVYAEVCDPQTFRPLPYGAEGTPVYTHLERTSMPMIRFAAGDLTTWTDEPCPCGRTYPRLPRGIYGRIDDQLTIRGENVFPSTIEEVLRREGYHDEYRIVVTREGTLDELTVRVETVERERDATRLSKTLRTVVGLRCEVDFVDVGTLPRSELKSRRVEDLRPKA